MDRLIVSLLAAWGFISLAWVIMQAIEKKSLKKQIKDMMEKPSRKK